MSPNFHAENGSCVWIMHFRVCIRHPFFFFSFLLGTFWLITMLGPNKSFLGSGGQLLDPVNCSKLYIVMFTCIQILSWCSISLHLLWKTRKTTNRVLPLMQMHWCESPMHQWRRVNSCPDHDNYHLVVRKRFEQHSMIWTNREIIKFLWDIMFFQ